MARQRFSNSLLSFILLALILVTAGGKIEAAEKIRFGTPVKLDPILYLPVLAADEHGFWKQNDVSVQWLPFKGGAALYRAVVAGSVDMGLSSTGSEMRAAGRGVPVVIVAESAHSQDFIVWVGSESRFKKPSDLKGARIGVPRLGGASQGFGLAIVKALGLEKDVKFIGAGGIRAELAALKTGKIDAIVEPITIPIKLKVQGVVRELVSTAQYLPKPWLAHVVFAHRDFMNAKPEAVGRAVKAFITTADFLRKNKRWAIDKMKEMSGYSDEAAQIVYARLDFTRDGKVRKEAVENVLNFFIEQGVIPRKEAPPVETLYTTKFTG